MVDRRLSRSLACLDLLLLVWFLAIGLAAGYAEPETLESTLGLVDSQVDLRLRRMLAESRGFPPTLPQPAPVKAILRRLSVFANRPYPAVLAFFTLGSMVVCFRPPLPTGRRWRSGPGALAVAAAGSVVGFHLVIELVERYFPKLIPGLRHLPIQNIWMLIAPQAAVAVLALWGLMLMARTWRLLPDWRERLGLGVGIAWLFHLAWVQWIYASLRIWIWDGPVPLVPGG